MPKTTIKLFIRPQTRMHGLPSIAFVSSPQCCAKVSIVQMTKQCVQSDTKYNDQRLLRMSIRPDAFSFNFGSTRLVVEHANVLKCGPLQRPAFPRGIKSSCGRPGACRSKQYELKQNAEFSFGVTPQGSF